MVTGSIELRDTNGNVLPSQARTVLCRCGASTKKPFCDGTHSKIGFQAAAQAVPSRLKAHQIRAPRGYLLETSEYPPQRWTPLNLTASSPASIRPTLKRQKAPVRRSNPEAGRRRRSSVEARQSSGRGRSCQGHGLRTGRDFYVVAAPVARIVRWYRYLC